MRKYLKSISLIGVIITIIVLAVMFFLDTKTEVNIIESKELTKYNAEQSSRAVGEQKVNVEFWDGGFADFIKPNATYQYSSTDVDQAGKTFTMVFDMTDKFYNTASLALGDLTILIDGEEPDWNTVEKSLQVEDRTNTVNGTSKVIGKRYTLTLSNLQQLQVKEGDKYLDYSGVVTVAIPANKIIDETGNGNNATTLTSGISLPGGTGTAEVVDVVQPLVEKVSSSVNVQAKTATVTFKVTDKYFANSVLTGENIQIVINGSESTTSITKQLTSTNLTEQRVVNGVTSTVQYGIQYTLTLTGLDTTVNQIKLRVPEGTITDQSGNGNKETDLIVFNTLKSTSTETEETSAFLGNTSIQRQNVDNVTFVDYVPEMVMPSESALVRNYDATNNTGNGHSNSTTTWKDLSGNQDGTINGATWSGDYLSLDGNDDWVSLGEVNLTNEVTLDATITVKSIQPDEADILCNFEEGGVGLELLSGVPTFAVCITDVGYVHVAASEKITVGEKTRITGTYDGTRLSLYIDGKLVAQKIQEGTIETPNRNAVMAIGVNPLGKVGNGVLDCFTDMNIYSASVYDEAIPTDVWDVSAMQDGSIVAWSEPSANGTYKVYIGSDSQIFGNVDSSYLFANIGKGTNCTSAETITNIGLLNVGNVTNMSYMFNQTGYSAMTNLDLGDNFATSNVTDMSNMFDGTGYSAMTSFDLGGKFDTSSVIDMSYMFDGTGYSAMTNLDLGDNFATSNVTNMSYMFFCTGYTAMTNLDLGEKFDTSQVTNMSYMFDDTGYTAMTSLDLGEKFDTSKVTDMSYMFESTGYTAMTSLDLGEKFDTSNVTDMMSMFECTGFKNLTSLDLGDKFNTTNVTNMIGMFSSTGYTAMTSLDLGPAFVHIPDGITYITGGPSLANAYMFSYTGKKGSIVIQAPEAIYQDATHFKSNTDSTTTIVWQEGNSEVTDYGTINPKYRTEWVKESAQVNTTDANNPKLNITLRGTTNTEVDPAEYISDVTSSLTANNIKVFIDDTEITDVVTKQVGTATQTNNTRTGAQDVLQTVTLSNFEEATRRTGKSYKEWSGNIRVEVAQGSLADTTGPADASGKKITYGNKNMEVASTETQTGATTGAGAVTEIGARIDNIVQDTTNVDKNTTNAMFADFIKPEFTYIYSSTDINYDAKTLTVEFSVTDKYFNSTTGLTNADGITVKMLDTDAVPENITKTLTKVEDINETRDGQEVKIGEKYRLVVSGLEQASIENGKYKEYSGPVSIVFPAGIASDKSGNTNAAKTITVGINEPDQTGEAEIVDVVDPMWRMGALRVDKQTGEVTVELYGTDKYYENNTLNVNKIKVIIDGEEITSTTNVTKSLRAPQSLTETRDGETVQYGVIYTLTLSNWRESDEVFEASGRPYREYSGNVELQIEAGTLVDESGNENEQTTINLGKIDVINPEIRKVSSAVDEANKKETIVFDVVDKDLSWVGLTTTDLSRIHVYVDDEETTGVTKTITNIQDLTATINGSSKVVGKRYTLELTDFEQLRTTVDYDREYTDWSGNVSITIDEGIVTDYSGNRNEETTIEGDFVDFINPDVTYQYADTDIDQDGKTFTMVFDVTDKFYTSGTLTLQDLTILIDGEEPDWAEVNKTLQVEDRTNTVNGTSKVIGKRYTLTLSNLEQIQVKDGDNYLDYSGVVTVAIPADKITDTTGNANDATTLTSGINLPGGTGTEEVVDVVQPLVEKISSTVDPSKGTASLVFRATDKYFASTTLTNENLQITVDGELADSTGVTKNVTSTPLNEQRMVNGVNTTVQYGLQFTVSLTGLETDVSQIKVRVPEGSVVDQSGNVNKETDLLIFNTLRSTAEEDTETSGFLGNTNIQRQNIDQVEFVDNVPEDIYNKDTDTYVNENAWDVSAMQDKTITAWYEEKTNGTYKVYIGSDSQIFGNIDSSYLFANIGYSSNCTSAETITNIELLNVGNVTNMSYMFDSTGYRAMTNLDLGTNFDTVNVTNMSYMFDSTGYRAMTTLDLGTNFDTVNVTNMFYMFENTGYTAMTSLDLGDKFDTSKVTNMQGMFFGTGYTKMTSLDLGDKFDTSNVTNMKRMFLYTGYTAMTSLDLGDKFDTSNVTSMNWMFMETGHNAMTSLDLGDKFDTSNVTSMEIMFYRTGYTAMTSLDLGDKFDTSKVTNMQGMFFGTGYTKMTSLDLGDKFDTSNVTIMNQMFCRTGYTAMTSLDLGDKFDTSNVTDMANMFYQTGYMSMTSLDLGPAFTYIPEVYTYEEASRSAYMNMFKQTGKSGEIVIEVPEAIYQDSTHFKLESESSIMFGLTDENGNEITTYGTINPKYRTEWVKETVQTDTTDVNNPKLNITLRGTTNTEVDPAEYISDVTSSLTANNIKVFIDDTEITDVVTKQVGTATQTNNTRTGAQDVLQTVTLSNFEEATRRTGKSYKEWSGNIRVEVAQGTLSDTTGPADAEGNRTNYGNKNMEVASTETQTGATTGAGAVTEIGARIDNIVQDTTNVDKNTTNAMFADFIKPEFTYIYSSTDINYDAKTLTVEFSVTDKYFNSTTGLTNADGIAVKMLDTNVVPENLTKTLTKVEDITENRDNTETKIGEKYKLVVSGWEQASIAEDGNYKEYSGPVNIIFPAAIATDKSGNTNVAKTITVGINEPDQTGETEIVDVVTPVWEAKNLNIDKANDRVTVDLYGTDKYYENNTLDISKIKVIIDGEEVTSTENVTKQLSAPTALTENRDGTNVQYGVKYTLTLSNWKESDTVFQASEKEYREYSGNTELQIEAGTLVDESGNENIETTLDLGMIDIINPEIRKVSSTKNDADETETIVFDVVDKYFESAQISTTDTSRIHVYVDNEEAIGVTKTITNVQDITAMVNGTSKIVGKRYTLVISNFEQERTIPVNYDREFSDWSGDVMILIDPTTAKDESGNTN